MARYNLADMTTPMANSAAITIALPVGGAFLLQSALMHMDQRHQWIDGTSPISDGDWDNLQEEIAALMLAIMTESEGEMAVPIGFVIPFAATTSPDHWLLCDGEQYLRVDYPELYAVLAPAFIVDADNFVVPDASARYIFGIGTNEFTVVGEIGGEDEIVLTLAHMPQDPVQIRVTSSGAAGTTVVKSGSGAPSAFIPSAYMGDGDPHNNLPPYIAMPYYIRAE